MFSAAVKFKKGLVAILRWLLIVLMAALTLDVIWGVFSRKILNNQSSWTEELARMLLIWVVLIGTSLAFTEKAHLGLDYLVGKLDKSARRLAGLLAHMVVLVFAVSVLCIGGGGLALKTIRMGQMLMALGIPKGCIYLALLISGVFVILFTIESLIELFSAPSNDPEEEEVLNV